MNQFESIGNSNGLAQTGNGLLVRKANEGKPLEMSQQRGGELGHFVQFGIVHLEMKIEYV